MPSGQLSSERRPRSIRRFTLSTLSPASSIAGRTLKSVNGALLRLLKYGEILVGWHRFELGGLVVVPYLLPPLALVLLYILAMQKSV